MHMRYKIDLHCHSNFSDGVINPFELIDRAIMANVNVFAITDHDSVDGIKLLLENNYLNNKAINFINGIELSVKWKKYDIHVLGLNINIYEESLTNLILRQKDCRVRRAKEIGVLLEKYGVNNAYEKALEIAQNNNIGRPHFAKLLVIEGHTLDMKSAFRDFLGNRKKAYVPTPWASLEEVVEVITKAGGEAYIAHPLKYKLTNTKIHELIKEFKLVGGCGIEVVSGDMQPFEIKSLADVCVKFNLLASSGSDFHTDNMSRVGIGMQKALPEICEPAWQKWSLN